MEPQPGSPTSPPFSPAGTTLWDNARAATPSSEEMAAAPDETKEEATELEPGRKSSASSSSSSSADIPCDIDAVDLVNPSAAALLPDDEYSKSEVRPVHSATPEDERRAGPDVHGGEAKPEDGQAGPAVTTAAGGSGFDPGRIPASVFQHRASASQAEWSVASNESLFSIQAANSDLYPGSRSHFDFYYDEAMAEAADSKLPSLEEEAPESAASAARGNNAMKGASVFRRRGSGSVGSSSNFSFAFPILAEMSPRKKDLVKPPEALQPPQQQQLEPPVSTFMEMTTEEERRRRDTGCCCCGCCWFDCSWCCRCPWWRCGCCCSCPCPSFCRCGWCLCS